MSKSPRAVHSPGSDKFLSRRPTAEEATDLYREGRRLIEQARDAQRQWSVARARMTYAQYDFHQNYRLPWADAAENTLQGRLHQEREAHGLSKAALARELIRGRRLEDEVLSIQDQERDRLARELHDGICQNLAGLTLLLEVHLRQLGELEPGAKALQSGQQVRELLSGAIKEMRGLSHGLGAVETGTIGENLCPALHALAERLDASGSVRCTTICPGAPALGRDKATHVYRIVQEAVGNAMRHGQAAHVEIRFEPVDGQWQLTVTDDGVGMPAAVRDGGLGMRSMQYRAAVLGGTLEVRRARALGERPGTVVRCTFP